MGLVRYASLFLPKLADYTAILTPLTTKAAKCAFPEWTSDHQNVFQAIKGIVVSRECLTIINHENMGKNKVFVTCDASGWLRGEDNTVADALSCVEPNAFPNEQLESCLPYSIWSQNPPAVPVGAILSIATDHSVLEAIHAGYETDEFCLKTRNSVGSVPGITVSNGLIYVGDQLLVPQAGDLRENLYRLAHDNLGHFGTDKSYASL